VISGLVVRAFMGFLLEGAASVIPGDVTEPLDRIGQFRPREIRTDRAQKV
jgi:hypothetical protein